jgi:hypothetical protein
MGSQAKVREKSALICREFYHFAACNGYTNVRINPIAVKSAVKSWADDAERHNSYHNSVLSPRKHIALMMYWFVKMKPIFLLPTEGAHYAEPKYSTSKYKTVNELFSLYLAFGHLGIMPKTAVRDKFVYLFFFRIVNPKHLFLTLELLCKSVPPYLKHGATNPKLTESMD